MASIKVTAKQIQEQMQADSGLRSRLSEDEPSGNASIDRVVSLREIIVALLRDHGVHEDDRYRLKQLMGTQAHPLVIVAQAGLRQASPPFALWTLPRLTEWFAKWCGLPTMVIDPLKIDFSRVAEVMSDTYAHRWKILPIDVSATRVVIATAEPYVLTWVRELEGILRRPIERVIANPADIERYISDFFALAKTVRGAQAKVGQGAAPPSLEHLVELGRDRQYDANDQHIVTIVDWLWQYAFEQRASDIHLEPRREMGRVRLRIDGVLHVVYQVPSGVMTAMLSRIKLLARMDLMEKRRPQDGRIRTKDVQGREVEMRLSTLPTAFGEKLVMRLFDPALLSKPLNELGFPATIEQRWQAVISQPHGLILVTGPTGSGKTSTLYATLSTVATDAVNVSTVEDPIEQVDGRFNQMQVQSGLDLSFADGIRSLMRQDPDVIMVGEIRDAETAEMAVQAALTGHLVFSTLHTNDAVSALTRLMDLGVQPYLIRAVLVGVLGQRLLRVLCPQCRLAEEPVPPAAWAELTRPMNLAVPARHWRPVGCPACRNTGYRGRVGVYEFFDAGAVAAAHPDLGFDDLNHIRDLAYQQGLQPLGVAAAALVAQGVTALEEALAACRR